MRKKWQFQMIVPLSWALLMQEELIVAMVVWQQLGRPDLVASSAGNQRLHPVLIEDQLPSAGEHLKRKTTMSIIRPGLATL